MEKTEKNEIKNDNKVILNEEYFLVDIKDEKILTKIQYTKKGGEALSFINGQRIFNYIGFNNIQNNGQPIDKKYFEEEVTNKENNMKTINNIKNELDYAISLEKTEKRFFDILEKRKDLDKIKILEALSFAKENHIGQTRDEGTPYIIHPISIATYAMKDGLDTDAVIVCLLHDVVEDTQKDNDYIQNEIAKKFGNNILFMTNKLSKKIGNKKKEINKYYEEIGNDILLSKIKGFDRLHNIYSLFLQPKKEKIENYIEKTEKEIFPLIYGTETFYNIQSILEIIKKKSENFDIYKEKIKNIKNIDEIKDKL